RGLVGADHLDAIRLRQLARAILAPCRGDYFRRCDAGPEHAREQRLTHLAGAKDRDHLAEPSGSPESAAGTERAQEESHVGRPLGEPPDQVAIPVVAVRHINPNLGTRRGQPTLFVWPDAVEHLVLKAAGVAAKRGGTRPRDCDEPRVVGREHWVTVAIEQYPHAARIVPVHLGAGSQRDAVGRGVRAFAQPYPGSGDRQRLAVTG